MAKRDFKTTLAAYRSFRWRPDTKVPTSGDTAQDLRILDRLYKRVVKAAQAEHINITKDHLS